MVPIRASLGAPRKARMRRELYSGWSDERLAKQIARPSATEARRVTKNSQMQTVTLTSNAECAMTSSAKSRKPARPKASTPTRTLATADDDGLLAVPGFDVSLTASSLRNGSAAATKAIEP